MAIAFFQACLCSRQWYGITKWEAIASSPHHNGILRLNSNSKARFCLSLHMALDCSQMYCLLATSAIVPMRNTLMTSTRCVHWADLQSHYKF